MITRIDAEAAQAEEKARIARRDAVKLKAHNMRSIDIQTKPFEAGKTACQQRIDTAESELQRVCEPLRCERENLEAAAFERDANQEPPDPVEAARLCEIAVGLAGHTREFNDFVDSEKSHQNVFDREIRKLTKNYMPPRVIQMELAKDNLACPKLLVQKFVNQQSAKYASARVQAARKSLKICRYNESEIQAGRMHGDIAACRRRVANWEAEIQAAEQASAESLAEGERIHAAMLAE